MRAYICTECREVLAIGSDGLQATAVKHVAANGEAHAGAEPIELPGHDHAAGAAWHHDHGRAFAADLHAAFPTAAGA